MYGYYDDNLAAERLKQVYAIAPPRIQQYLEAEVSHVLERIRQGDVVLDLGCGYGRVLPRFAAKARAAVGIDTSLSSLVMAQKDLCGTPDCFVLCMDAVRLGFRDGVFDVVVCIQNGMSAFHVDRKALIRESFRVTRPGGTVLFSTYSQRFWDDRLEWFRLQSEAGLLGEMDYEKTRNGVIVCKDGFTGTAVAPEELEILTGSLDADVMITEVDGSSVFCEIKPRSGGHRF
ncbi:MAG: class I SAM-dependent methyltransferase [Candidatus Eisenbacteria bacterium]